jgi:hypothetical protein
MKRLLQTALSIVTLIAFSFATPLALAQEDTHKGKPTVGGQMKEAGKETGKASKSLGSNVKHGRVARGGKHFGVHLGHAGKNVGKGSVKATKNVAHGTKKVAKGTGKAIKKAVTPQ